MQTPQPAQGKNNSRIIIGVIVALLLCCCLIGGAFAAYSAYQTYNAGKSAVNSIQTAAPDFSVSPPAGGLGDDQTRTVAWTEVEVYALAASCSAPKAADTTISVQQKPDSSGVWVEQWTLKCGDGSTKDFKLTFTPDPNGGPAAVVIAQP